jgi:hypothetical protein
VIVTILATIVKIKKSHTLNQNFLELIAKIPSIKDVVVLEKLGGGAFGDVFHGLVNVCIILSS